MAKATNAETQQRIQQVYRQLLAGSSRAQIIMQFAAKWEVKNRQIDTYIRRATDMMVVDSEFHRKAEFGKALARLNLQYRTCLKDKDQKTLLAVQKEINALLSLYLPPPVQTLQLLGIDQGAINILNAELESRGLSLAGVIQSMLKEIGADGIG